MQREDREKMTIYKAKREARRNHPYQHLGLKFLASRMRDNVLLLFKPLSVEVLFGSTRKQMQE